MIRLWLRTGFLLLLVWSLVILLMRPVGHSIGGEVLTYVRVTTQGELRLSELIGLDLRLGIQHLIARTQGGVPAYNWSPDGSQIAMLGTGDFRPWIRLFDSAGRSQEWLTETRHTPHWSPDGSRIAYERAATPGDTDIFIVALSDGEPVNLTDSPLQSESEPRWLDSDTLVYEIASDDGSQLVRHNIQTGQSMLLTSPPEGGAQPVPSPDGYRIAYIEIVDNSPVLAWMQSDGSQRERVYITGGRYDMQGEVWSPDSQQLAFIDSSLSLVILDLASRERRILRPGSTQIYTRPGDWSPDARWIAVTEDRRIYLIDVHTGQIITVSEGESRSLNMLPRWRPGA